MQRKFPCKAFYKRNAGIKHRPNYRTEVEGTALEYYPDSQFIRFQYFDIRGEKIVRYYKEKNIIFEGESA